MEQSTVHKIWSYPSKEWLPIGDYTSDGRSTLAEHCGLTPQEVKCLMGLVRTTNVDFLREHYHIHMGNLYDKWFCFFDRGWGPQLKHKKKRANAVGKGTNPDKYFNQTSEGQQYKDKLQIMNRQNHSCTSCAGKGIKRGRESEQEENDDDTSSDESNGGSGHPHQAKTNKKTKHDHDEWSVSSQVRYDSDGYPLSMEDEEE